jgi:hypothetical protein
VPNSGVGEARLRWWGRRSTVKDVQGRGIERMMAIGNGDRERRWQGTECRPWNKAAGSK